MSDALLLTKNELARLLRCSRSTLERMEKKGEIPPRFAPMSGRRRMARWRRTDVDAFLERGAA